MSRKDTLARASAQKAKYNVALFCMLPSLYYTSVRRVKKTGGVCLYKDTAGFDVYDISCSGPAWAGALSWLKSNIKTGRKYQYGSDKGGSGLKSAVVVRSGG